MPTLPSGAADPDPGAATPTRFTARALADLLGILRELHSRRAIPQSVQVPDQASDGQDSPVEPRG